MDKRGTVRPTAAELEILQVLWELGPATVRQVNDRLSAERTVGYTTTLKLMQIMHEKGLLDRDETQRSHRYAPAVRRGETQQRLLDRFVAAAFGGSAAKLVMQALSDHRASPEEISEIRQFLDRLEEERNGTAR